MIYKVVRNQELYHHGILGMHWGDRNGPPYPLGTEQHSKEEKQQAKNAGVQVGEDSGTSKRKTHVKMGAKIAVGLLATYGAYRLHSSGQLVNIIAKGRALAGSAEPTNKTFDQIKDIINPLKNERNHCTNCSVATFLSMNGRPASALGTNGKQQILGGVVEDIFKFPGPPQRRNWIVDGSAVKFGKSKKDAAEMLVKRFGENAQGVVSIEWKKSFADGGHAFNWSIENGVVKFFDGQKGVSDDFVYGYWRNIDPQGALTLARLDGLEIDEQALKKYVKLR